MVSPKEKNKASPELTKKIWDVLNENTIENLKDWEAMTEWLVRNSDVVDVIPDNLWLDTIFVEGNEWATNADVMFDMKLADGSTMPWDINATFYGTLENGEPVVTKMNWGKEAFR
jgi:hypothetical protein